MWKSRAFLATAEDNLPQVDSGLTISDEFKFASEQYKDQYPDITIVEFYKKCLDIPLFDVSVKRKQINLSWA